MSMVRSFIGSAYALSFVTSALADASDTCTPPRWEDVTIETPGAEPVLADGRVIKFAGLSSFNGPAPVLRGPARLSVTIRAPDRWGRITGILTPPGQGIEASVNVASLRQGAAVAQPDGWPTGCYGLAVAAEEDARQARRGLWIDPPVIAASDVATLVQQIGRFTLVEGRIRSVRQGRRQIFLNFGPYGEERFSATIALSRISAFAAAGLDPLSLRGRVVLIRGVVGVGPSMELNKPEALSVSVRR